MATILFNFLFRLRLKSDHFLPFVKAGVAEITERHSSQGKRRRHGNVLLASILLTKVTCSKVCICASLDIARICCIHELFSLFATQYSTSHKEVGT